MEGNIARPFDLPSNPEPHIKNNESLYNPLRTQTIYRNLQEQYGSKGMNELEKFNDGVQLLNFNTLGKHYLVIAYSENNDQIINDFDKQEDNKDVSQAFEEKEIDAILGSFGLDISKQVSVEELLLSFMDSGRIGEMADLPAEYQVFEF